MAFHEQRFPLRLSLTSSGGPGRQTDIVSLSNGREGIGLVQAGVEAFITRWQGQEGGLV